MTAVTEAAGPDALHGSVARKNIGTMIFATSIGNALEWFDITVYGYFALYISKAFFPASDPATSMLLALGTFGISYLSRPIGGIVLGAYADKHGRKASLMISIVLMTLGTLSIAVMPGYATIGLFAPAGILIARLLQGFSAGGEFGSSTAFLVEHAPERRGLTATWQFASQGFSTLVAASFGMGLGLLMTPADLQDWGWRLPFLFGVLIGPVGLYIRNRIEDATAPPALIAGKSPTQAVFLEQKGRVGLAIGVLAISTAVNYLLVYMPTYVVKTLNMPATVGFTAAFAGGLVLSIVVPLAGWMSDFVGRTRMMVVVTLMLILSIYPSFLFLTNKPTATTIVLAVFWLATLKALYYGPLAACMADLFPAYSRATGLGLSYNIGVTLFGGMGPVIMASLGTIIGGLAPAYYLTCVAFISLASLLMIWRRIGLT
ncbi:MFS transporter [Beijerinckia sp. L45]|uniref:MFS transporter n=1 Tax=Beijerinckia sp. L45 TaxID=1641855 RepID=UPI00131D0925|nr:MFS transporter [Beijerinckia sp. L45]